MLKIMYLRYTKEVLKELMDIFPDPKTGDIGIKPSALSVYAGFKSRQSVYSFLQGTEPNREAREKLGRFFKIVRFADDETINNDQVLHEIRAFLDTFVHKKDPLAG